MFSFLLCLLICHASIERTEASNATNMIKNELENVIQQDLDWHVARNLNRLFPNLVNVSLSILKNSTTQKGKLDISMPQLCLLIYDSYFRRGPCAKSTEADKTVGSFCKFDKRRIYNPQLVDTPFCDQFSLKQNIQKRKRPSTTTRPTTLPSTTTTTRPTTLPSTSSTQITSSTTHSMRLSSTATTNTSNKLKTLTPFTFILPRPEPGVGEEPLMVLGGVSSTYFFLAINVIAKTVSNTHKTDCAKRGGEFDPHRLTCRILGYPEVKKIETPDRYSNKPEHHPSSKNNSSILPSKNISEIIHNGLENVTSINETWKNTTEQILISYRLPKASKTLGLLTIIGNSCSIVCLIALIGTYFIVKSEFSLMDKNVVCLSIFLCLAHVLQLTTVFFSETVVYCKISAVLLHWSLLVSFSWMSVISYDLFITFTKLRKLHHDTTKKRFKRYLIIVFTACTTIVLICVFLGIPKIDYAGYGYQGKCFITKFWANLIAFTIPVILMLLLNALLMVVTIYKLRSMQKASHRALTQNDNQQSARKKVVISALTLKLSVLFGLGWLFGFIGPFIASTAMQFVFNLIVSFQGTFIYIAFGCHKSLVDRCCKRKVTKRDRLLNPSSQNTKSTSV